MSARRALLAVAATAALAVPAPALADSFLRVIAQEAPVHTGPSPRYRQIHQVDRGEVLEVVERGTEGYWFRVVLDDGTSGWIFGELVFPFEVAEPDDPGFLTRVGRRVEDAVLGPSPVPGADVEISFSAGALDGEGFFTLRPAWLLDRYLALEAFLGLSPRKQDDLYLAGLGWTLRLLPGAAIGPTLHLGAGGAQLRPKADNFTQDPVTLLAMTAGGGLEITFKKRITVRLDYRSWTLFDPDQASNGQELSGGLAIFF